jgi:hypothetical protein
MRSTIITSLLLALAVNGAPVASTEAAAVNNQWQLGYTLRTVQKIVPPLQQLIASHPELGIKLAKSNPALATESKNGQPATIDFTKLQRITSQLEGQMDDPVPNSATDLLTAGSTVLVNFLMALPGAIFDGVSFILSSEWTLLSTIFSGLTSWIPGFSSTSTL